MPAIVNDKMIEDAFRDDPQLKKRVFNAISVTPQHAELFEEIARYTENLRNGILSNGIVHADDEPTTKKRKLANGHASHIGPALNEGSQVIFEAKDVSFSIPQRKKLHLEIAQSTQGDGRYSIRTRNSSSGDIEYEAPASAFDHVLRLPVPEKAQKQYNFCLIPSSSTGARNTVPADDVQIESLLFTINHGPLKSAQYLDPELQKAFEESGSSIVDHAINFAVQKPAAQVVYPDETEFASATPEAHRKGEKAYHVKAFKGSKDGYLFFLSTGIFFGFKKPVQFFAFDVVESISYTSVLQRTFNLNISYKLPEEAAELRDQEFSMIDQVDFAGIDAYIKRHELQDASMAEARKAKRLNINKGKNGAAEEHGQNGEEPGELQKATQEIEDAEEEEEEDYDPGSDGESDGSGTSSEEEDDDAAHNGIEGNLVEEELGSEAEEVEPDPDDDEQL